MTRDAIQGYIDGYVKAGGQNFHKDFADWMTNHPLYPQSPSNQSVIMSDLSSYRNVPSITPPVVVGP